MKLITMINQHIKKTITSETQLYFYYITTFLYLLLIINNILNSQKDKIIIILNIFIIYVCNTRINSYVYSK